MSGFHPRGSIARGALWIQDYIHSFRSMNFFLRKRNVNIAISFENKDILMDINLNKTVEFCIT